MMKKTKAHIFPKFDNLRSPFTIISWVVSSETVSVTTQHLCWLHGSSGSKVIQQVYFPVSSSVTLWRFSLAFPSWNQVRPMKVRPLKCSFCWSPSSFPFWKWTTRSILACSFCQETWTSFLITPFGGEKKQGRSAVSPDLTAMFCSCFGHSFNPCNPWIRRIRNTSTVSIKEPILPAHRGTLKIVQCFIPPRIN